MLGLCVSSWRRSRERELELQRIVEATQSTSTPRATPAYPSRSRFQDTVQQAVRRVPSRPRLAVFSTTTRSPSATTSPTTTLYSTTTRSPSATTSPRSIRLSVTPSTQVRSVQGVKGTTSRRYSTVPSTLLRPKQLEVTSPQPSAASPVTVRPRTSAGSSSEEKRHHILLPSPSKILHLVYLLASLICTCLLSYAAGCLSGCALER